MPVTKKSVAVLGATGHAGSRIVKELLQRGHRVRALIRDPGRLQGQSVTEIRVVDVDQPESVTEALRGSDALISAVKFKDFDAPQLIAAVQKSGVSRWLVVGGAGSLFTAPGVREMDSPRFPPTVLPEARLGANLLDLLRQSELDWTFLSPSRFFEPGQRTGRFRLGTDQLLFGADGRSAISMEDYAIAMVDELERDEHVRARFTVGY